MVWKKCRSLFAPYAFEQLQLFDQMTREQLVREDQEARDYLLAILAEGMILHFIFLRYHHPPLMRHKWLPENLYIEILSTASTSL